MLVLHGIADSRSSEFGLAGMFLSHGYIVLAPDSRTHGASGGDLATYGLLEAGDVPRWVSWLIGEQHPRTVYGLGESLGAAVLIQSLSLEPRFSAIAAECSFSSFDRIAEYRVAQMLPFSPRIGRLLAAPPVWAGFLYARLRYGLDRTMQLWLVPGAGHTGAFRAAPREFEQRILRFFALYQNLPPGIQVREK